MDPVLFKDHNFSVVFFKSKCFEKTFEVFWENIFKQSLTFIIIL